MDFIHKFCKSIQLPFWVWLFPEALFLLIKSYSLSIQIKNFLEHKSIFCWSFTTGSENVSVVYNLRDHNLIVKNKLFRFLELIGCFIVELLFKLYFIS